MHHFTSGAGLVGTTELGGDDKTLSGRVAVGAERDDRPVAHAPHLRGDALDLGLGLQTAAGIMLGVLVVFATLEAALGFCAGCWAFGHLMRLGVIPEETCEACADITRRRPAVEEPVTTA